MASVKNFGVIGSGQMGAGIAQVAAQSGMNVVLFDIAEASLEKARSVISKSLNKLEEKGKLTDSVDTILSRLKLTSTLSDLKETEFVVEAATENRAVKFKLFKDLDDLLPKSSLLLSNTSSISITEIAAQTSRPDKVAGMHFMNPVPLMKLVECIEGLATSKETFDTVTSVAQAMGKTPVRAKDAPGFAVNRILIPMINEAFFALQEGLATAEDIDEAMKLGCNFPMGPLTLADFVGLDTLLSICEILQKDLGDSKYRPCPLLRKYVEAGWVGRKVGRGVYEY